MSVSIHVTDSVYGRPAVGLTVKFTRELEGAAVEQWRDQTGEDGRISRRLDSPGTRGPYIIEIDLDRYFSTLGYASLISSVSTRFRVANETSHCELSIFITPASCFVIRAG
jgi:5-hydroxyisourate hydrolase-like protein (transthyretin family)